MEAEHVESFETVEEVVEHCWSPGHVSTGEKIYTVWYGRMVSKSSVL